MFCGYVVFDTQMIIEKASMGDKDSLRHALDQAADAATAGDAPAGEPDQG